MCAENKTFRTAPHLPSPIWRENAVMWEPGLWMAPMWGSWWVFPLAGLLVCFVFMFALLGTIVGGARFMDPHQRKPCGDESA